DGASQLIAVGAEGQAKHLGGQLLGGGRLEVSALKGAVELLVPGGGSQAGCPLAKQGLQRRRGRRATGVLYGNPRAEQGIRGERGRAGEVAQRSPHRLLEIRLREDRQRRP